MNHSFVALPHRQVISLTGPDTISLLERLVTNGVQDWPEKETRYGALLTPQGKVLADYLAIRTQNGVLLDCDRDAAADFAKRLKMFRLRSDVAIELENDLTVFAQVGSNATDSMPSPDPHSVAYADIRFSKPRQRVITRAEPDEVSLDDYHRDRIENGVAEMGADFETASVFPSDINMDQLGGVDLKKGCFVGQEVVSRMHRRGKVRRRTVYLQGDELTQGKSLGNENSIGEVTSVAGQHGLAQVRTDRLAKLLREQKSILVDGAPVELHLPGWMQEEMEAMELG